MSGGDPGDEDLLPNFCSSWVIVNVALAAEMLAILITVVTRPILTDIFQDLVVVSMYVQWIAICSTALLCGIRKWLNQLSETRAWLMAYLLLLGVAVLVAESTVWVAWLAGISDSPRPDWYLYRHAQTLTVAAIVDALVLRYLMARHQLRRSALAEAQARMEVLKYRIRPHFLFNSMNIIASLTRRAPGKAERAIEDMSDVFRLMLDEQKNLVPLSSEIDVAHKYLALETLRLDKRLKVDWRTSETPRTARVPVLMLQLLLENGIHSGIEALPKGGEIGISIRLRDDRIVMEIESPPPRADAEEQLRTLDNVRQRLLMHYGDDARLELRESEERQTVRVEFPAFGGLE
ncbi:MAG: histidine kinase [Gammaproteobacteria bacterium]|nr:histidine kinase [Gammaproteobacteria bacterium]